MESNQLSGTQKSAHHDNWKRGPLPPDTWGWGGVQVKGMASGFYYADFRGDHVLVSSKDDQPAERFKPEDVKWYMNPIQVSPPE